MAIAASSVTTVLSLKAQRDNTNSTLETQRTLATAQEDFARERSHAGTVTRCLGGNFTTFRDLRVRYLQTVPPDEVATLARWVVEGRLA